MLSKKALEISGGFLLIALSAGLLFLLPWLPLHSDKRLDPALLPDNHGRYAVVFFGYPGCNTVCPVTLSVLAQVYTAADTPGFELVFVNLDSSLDEKTARRYARRFHPAFIVYHLAPVELARMVRAFGVSYSERENRVTGHTEYVYLLRKEQAQWVVRQVYKNADPKVILQDLHYLQAENTV